MRDCIGATIIYHERFKINTASCIQTGDVDENSYKSILGASCTEDGRGVISGFLGGDDMCRWDSETLYLIPHHVQSHFASLSYPRQDPPNP